MSNGNHSMREPTRLERTETALKQLIDYTMALNAIAMQKGLWTVEEFNRAFINMDAERKALRDIGHDAGMRVLYIAKKIEEFKPPTEKRE